MPTPQPAATPSPAEQKHAANASLQAKSGIALARFEALSVQREKHRRRICLQPLGADPTAAAPAGWSAHRASELVAAASAAQQLSTQQVEGERQRLFWIAVAKLVGAVVAVALALALAIAMLSGLEG